MPTKELTYEEEINQATNELKLALMENLEASKAEDRAKIRKIKAQKRLSLARDQVRAVTIHQ